MKTDVQLWKYLALFFLKRQMFQAKFVEKVQMYFVVNNFF